MALYKNDIPILEYDDSKTAVIMPTHENLKIQLPEKAVFGFLEDVIDCGMKEPLIIICHHQDLWRLPRTF